ncbi:hypothetical protein JWG41_06850 [Leptospira sp. 201903075]|uniref:hypothetical protein n=1 Tax=Leptospira chreensis TaxID=2810035 RepID=UPI001964E72D|nr:hypothetical protein [Leptospira chreensis]MBM9590156.1 hypothetical protein [Leptospira chreensis]
MSLKSRRADQIEAYIKEHDCQKGKQKLLIGGKVEIIDSFLLPTDLLQYNIHNRRFNLEISEYVKKLGRKLNPEDKEDINIIKEFLLQDELEAKKLKEDLQKVGEQIEVGAITFDGIIINGNRRMATIQLLDTEQPTGKWKFLWVVRLPKDISAKDLWRIEAGLQLSKEKIADYGPINNLLMIAEGEKAGLTHAEIAASMYGWSEKQVRLDLDRLKLIENFLSYFKQPKNYGVIKSFQLHEHFIDLQKGLVEKKQDLGLTTKSLANKLEIAFMYLATRITNPSEMTFTHNDVRNLCKILVDTEAEIALLDEIPNSYSNKPEIINKLIDNFDNASDVKKNKESKEKPSKLIEKSITALNGIDRTTAHYKTDRDVKIKIGNLHKLVLEMITELGLESFKDDKNKNR